jgi:Aromatic-ring hydroxylase, C-terminal
MFCGFQGPRVPGQQEARDDPPGHGNDSAKTIPAFSWTSPKLCGDGAILVRPDRFIAWRSPVGSGEPRAALAAALSRILAWPVGTPAASAA